MKVLFFGSSDYCIPILENLHSRALLSGVITRPDRPMGRKQILTPSAVKKFAIEKNIEVFTPENKDSLILLKDELSARQYDLAVVADFGMIIPKVIFEIPKHHTINVHFSKLPSLRGASPVQFTILKGEKTSWITLIVMDETMDTGDIIWQKEFPLMENETTQDLYTRLFSEIGKEIPNIISDFINGKIPRIPQDHSKATYTKRLSRDDGFIPYEILKLAINGKQLNDSLKKSWPIVTLVGETSVSNLQTFLVNELRAFSPWPGLWTEIEVGGIKKRMKILKIHTDKTNKLVLDVIQMDGKNPSVWNPNLIVK